MCEREREKRKRERKREREGRERERETEVSTATLLAQFQFGQTFAYCLRAETVHIALNFDSPFLPLSLPPPLLWHFTFLPFLPFGLLLSTTLGSHNL